MADFFASHLANSSAGALVMKLSAVYGSLFHLSQTVLSAVAAPVEPCDVVKLDGYGSFTGLKINSTLTKKPLPATVDAWLGIDYASQPVGEDRFKPVGWPKRFKGTKNATSYGKVCVQDPLYISYAQDEACLNLNVYRTAGVPLRKKLPVLVWIHGGAFVAGSGRSIDGAAFVASSKAPIVVVSFNYRLNSLGFLPSQLFEDEGLLNLGLLDQRLLLEFLQKHVASFGGDPEVITLGGRSAGGHSVGIHYFHNYGNTAGNPLFQRAIMQSGSVTARGFPGSDYPLYQRQFAEYMSYLDCPTDGDDNKAAMACLRSANITDIQTISSKLYADSEYNITWPFQPTLGGPLLEKLGSISGIEGTFHHLPVITSTVTDEAKYYSPGDLETNQQFLDFLSNQSPGMTPADVSDLATLYPDPATDLASPYANSPNSTQYNRISAALSDYMYICAGQETAYRASSAGVKSTWKLRFDTPDNVPAWKGIPHTSDSRYTWDSPDAQYQEVSHLYHAYLASFVATGDPNKLRFTGSPVWPTYDPKAPQQLAVHPGNATTVEKDAIRTEQCLWWREPERQKRLNK